MLKWEKKRQISLFRTNPNWSPPPGKWKYLWRRKHGSKTVDGVLRTHGPYDLSMRADEALQRGVHVSFGSPSAQFLAHNAVNRLPTSAAWGPAGCGTVNSSACSLSNWSKQVFIIHEAEQGCHYISGFSGLPPSSVHRVWKMFSCNIHDRKAAYHRRTWLAWCAPQTNYKDMLWILLWRVLGPLSLLCLPSFWLFWGIGYLIIFRH